jgi:hypothetical protein
MNSIGIDHGPQSTVHLQSTACWSTVQSNGYRSTVELLWTKKQWTACGQRTVVRGPTSTLIEVEILMKRLIQRPQ